MTFVGVAVVGLGLLLLPVPAVAHHAFAAAFDDKKPINLRARSRRSSWSIPIRGSGWM
jgi:hypothetical protein